MISVKSSVGSSRAGQSIAEVLIAIAIGVLFVGGAASLIIPSLKSNTQAANIQAGTTLANGLLNNVRVWSQGNWNSLLSLATGTSNIYFLQTASSPFIAATGTEYVVDDGDTSGLVGWWKLDEGSGTSTIDSSGNGNTGVWNGTAVGTGGTYYTAGRMGQYAGDFDGTTDYIKTGTANFPTGSAPFSISAWINDTNGTSFQMIYFYGSDGTAAYLNMNNGCSGNRPELQTWGGAYTACGPAVTTSTWHYIVGTYNGSQFTVYSDGQAGTSVSAPSVAISNVYGMIGAYDGGDRFSGAIDDVRVYNRALSATDINEIYKNDYRRYFYLSDVYRNGSGTITASGGNYDPSTKLVTVGYAWPGGATNTMSTYLTRNQNFTIDQTDWSGGSGQNGPMTSTNSQFATSSNIDYSTTTGSFYLAIPGY